MPETKLKLFQDEILRHPLKLCEFYPSQVPHLAVAKEFLVGLADNDDAALVGNKVFAQPTASTAEQPIAATLPQCSTPSQSNGAAARLKSANSSTASVPAAYLVPILSATKGFASPLFIGICKTNPLHPPGSGILRRPLFWKWSQANLRPYQAPNAAYTVFP